MGVVPSMDRAILPNGIRR